MVRGPIEIVRIIIIIIIIIIIKVSWLFEGFNMLNFLPNFAENLNVVKIVRILE